MAIHHLTNYSYDSRMTSLGDRVMEIVRHFPVSEAGYAGDWVTAAHMEVVNRIPVWTQHPIYTAMRAVGYETIQGEDHIAGVYVRYVNTDAMWFTGDSYTDVIQTDMDRYGNILYTSNYGAYVNGGVYPLPDGGGTGGITGVRYGLGTESPPLPKCKIQTGKINESIPINKFGISRVMFYKFSGQLTQYDPILIQRAFTDCINNATFYGYSPGHVLCESVHFDNQSLGSVAHTITAFFLATTRPKYWEQDIIYQENGVVPAGISVSPGDMYTRNWTPVSGVTVPYGRYLVNNKWEADFNWFLATYPNPTYPNTVISEKYE